MLIGDRPHLRDQGYTFELIRTGQPSSTCLRTACGISFGTGRLLVQPLHLWRANWALNAARWAERLSPFRFPLICSACCRAKGHLSPRQIALYITASPFAYAHSLVASFAHDHHALSNSPLAALVRGLVLRRRDRSSRSTGSQYLRRSARLQRHRQGRQPRPMCPEYHLVDRRSGEIRFARKMYPSDCPHASLPTPSKFPPEDSTFPPLNSRPIEISPMNLTTGRSPRSRGLACSSWSPTPRDRSVTFKTSTSRRAETRAVWPELRLPPRQPCRPARARRQQSSHPAHPNSPSLPHRQRLRLLPLLPRGRKLPPRRSQRPLLLPHRPRRPGESRGCGLAVAWRDLASRGL